jgi:hypothetical protein
MLHDVIAVCRVATASTHVIPLVQYDVIVQARKSVFRARARSWLHNLVPLLGNSATDRLSKVRLRGDLFTISLPSSWLTCHNIMMAGFLVYLFWTEW